MEAPSADRVWVAGAVTILRRLAVIGPAAFLLLALACGGDGGPKKADNIQLPEGFQAYEFASGLKEPTAMAFDDQGRLFVSELEGKIKLLEDKNADGRADSVRLLWEGFGRTTGFTFGPDGALYVSHREKVAVIQDPYRGGKASDSVQIIEDLPTGASQNNGIAFGPDGKLYITLGSTCNLCSEKDTRSASILRANADGSGLGVFAHGLRNAYDLLFDGEGRLWATTNEVDPWEAVDTPYRLIQNAPDELNLITQGSDYGWPDSAGDDLETIPGGCLGKTPPVVEFEPSASSDGFVLYEGDSFPSGYRGSFFVAEWGSDDRSPNKADPKVVRVTINESSQGFSGKWEEFASGFARPLDVAVAPDGALFVLDWETGTVYRIVAESEGPG